MCARITGSNRWLFLFPERTGPGQEERTVVSPTCFRSPPSLAENLLRLAVLGLALLAVGSSAHACGPFFPNNLLDRGDEAVLVAPLADFARELERLKLATCRFDYVRATNGYAAQTCDAEMLDLTAALKRAKVSPEESARIIEGHRVNRQKLSEYLVALEAWESKAWMDADENTPTRRGPAPAPPDFDEVPGLPGEFADYFEGASAFQNPDADEDAARIAWERLLARPAAERKYKSTWAAFMLGKIHEETDDDKALEYYQMARELAKHGFADSTGLAAASIGWEARICYRNGEFGKAINLYLEQLAAGDTSAATSLRLTALAALDDRAQLQRLATDPAARQVITSYLVSWRGAGWSYEEEQKRSNELVIGWLNAIEAAEVKDVELAEKLALAAYQGGAFDEAQRWIKRSGSSLLAQWLQAKLLLRSGKVAPAAGLLAKVSRSFPAELPGTNAPVSFDETLSSEINPWDHDNISIGKQVLGELGVVRLARREYAEALDALLHSGYWMDAAYVAERVLTTDELKVYVERNWPEAKSRSTSEVEPTSGEAASEEEVASKRTAKDIRYLLGRRLTRDMRAREAREYYPEEQRSSFDELVLKLDSGWNESLPVEERARSLFQAAIIARTNGMELLGTEVGPDWHYHDGQFESELSAELRTNENFKVLPASADELRRATGHRADPEVRFHYRYQAAFLAWEAAKLMPNNSDETARMLCTAGSWLKGRDPATADIFYKALVRRCRQTAIGEQADKMRWFPVLDADGEPIPYRPRVPIMEAQASAEPATESSEVLSNSSAAANIYVVHRGDSLAMIAQAAGVTVKQIVESNPGLEPARLKVGQRILIPESSSEPESESWEVPP